MRKKLLSLLLAAVMAFSLLPAAAFASNGSESIGAPLQDTAGATVTDETESGLLTVSYGNASKGSCYRLSPAGTDCITVSAKGAVIDSVSFAVADAQQDGLALLTASAGSLSVSGSTVTVSGVNAASLTLRIPAGAYDAAALPVVAVSGITVEYTKAEEPENPAPGGETPPQGGGSAGNGGSLFGGTNGVPSDIYWAVKGTTLTIYADAGSVPPDSDASGSFSVSTKYGSSPWSSYASSITAVTVAETVVPLYTAYWFKGFSALESADLSKLDTHSVTTMRQMFSDCSSLTTLDLSGWDVSAVTDYNTTFGFCSKLTTLKVSGWNVSAATDMGGIFSCCSALTSLDLSGWNTQSLTSAANVFNSCSALSEIMAPVGLPLDVSLPTGGTWLANGTVYTALPKELASSVTLTKNYVIKLPASLTGGSVTASNATEVSGSYYFPAGETAELTVTPQDGFLLKADSLKVSYSDGGTKYAALTQDSSNTDKYTFTMPAKNVTVTAEFEKEPDAWTALQNAMTGSSVTHAAFTAVISGDTITVTLQKDITCTDQTAGPLLVPAGKTVVLDLNGHSIDRGRGATDAEYIANGNVITVDGGSLTVNGSGSITGGRNQGYGGGVLIDNSGSLILNNGSITGNYGGQGGGGAAVKSGSMTINGGEVSGNDAAVGGGIDVEGEGTLTITGGTVSGNNANMTGGINVLNGTFTMVGGAVTGNTGFIMLGNLGGVGGSGSFTLGGTAKISGNTGKNLNIPTNKITVATGSLAPAAGMSVGVSMGIPGVFTNNEADSYIDYFFADDSAYSVLVTADKKLTLAKPLTVTVETPENGTVTADKTTSFAGDTVTLTVTPDEGYRLKTLVYNDGSADTDVPENAGAYTFTMPAKNVTVKAVFEPVPYTVTVEAPANGTVTADKTTAVKGDTVTLTVKPAKGFRLISLVYNDGSADTDIPENAGAYTFTMPAKNVTVKASFDYIPVEYKITAGANGQWYKDSTMGLPFTSNAPFAKFAGVKVDGTTIDPANYTAKSGSTKVTLDPGYLQTLSEGAHTLEITSIDGSASTVFTVLPAPPKRTVNFVMNGHGTQLDSKTVTDGSKLAKPANPSATGYTFGGWYTDTALTKPYNFNSAVTSDLTLYAKWTTYSGSSGRSPSTGDNSHVAVWAAVLSACCGAAVVLINKKRNGGR